MSASFQYTEALRALDYIEYVVLKQRCCTTYNAVCEKLGYGSIYARAVGQVISRIDAACFYSKLPYLASAKVRKANGEINPDSFCDFPWAAHRAKLIAAANDRVWTADDFAKIRRVLSNSLPDDSAKLLWERIDALGEKAVQRSLESAGLGLLLSTSACE